MLMFCSNFIFKKLIAVLILACLFASNQIQAESQYSEKKSVPISFQQDFIQYPVIIFDSTSNSEFPNNFRTSYSPYSRITSDSPTRIGLDALNISGSAQFTETNLKNILGFLKYYVAPKNIIIVDLRQESHGFLDNMPVSWYAESNSANQDKTAAEIKLLETSLLDNLRDQDLITVNMRQKEKNAAESTRFIPYEVSYQKALTEAKMLKKYAAKYKRFYVKDHHAPTAEQVDEFLNFIATLPNNTWLHFHCRAGIGRTTTFMAMLDILRNAHKVTLEGIIKRQVLIGGTDLLDTKRGLEQSESKEKRKEFITQFYRYASDVEGYPKTNWSEWLKSHGNRPRTVIEGQSS